MSREKFDAWFDKEYSAARNHELPGLVEELREVKWVVWQAAWEEGEAERDALRKACVDAVLALAHASERWPEYNAAYKTVSDVIAAIAAKEQRQ